MTEKLMEIFWQNVLANSIPLSIIVFGVYQFAKRIAIPYIKNHINRVDVMEDKQDAFIITLINGDYDKFVKEYERLAKERVDKHKK